MNKLLWLCCYETNYPWGAETAMLEGFQKNPEWQVKILDYRLCKKLNVNIYNVAKRWAKDCTHLLLQRCEGIALKELVNDCKLPVLYLASEGANNRDQLESFKQLKGKAKLLVRGGTYEQVLELRYKKKDLINFILGYNQNHYFNNPEIEYKYDVVLSGTLTDRRNKLYEKLINKCKANNINIVYTSASGLECGNVYNQARCVVNMHSYNKPDTQTRVFEVMATKAILITEKLTENIDKESYYEFKIGDVEDCFEKIKEVLKKNNAKNVIKKANKIAKKYSWQVYSDEILKLF